ncbi:MAG: 3-hydroxyacyl-CoA dehydrogenase family protein, partial [Gammaproteobacteria bacterium]
DFRQIDRAMEKFGWPMGPAYLLDVVGIDTAVHAQGVMAAGFERMQLGFESAIDKLFARGDLGQKTGRGFYRYEPDRKGKPRKLPNPDMAELIASVQTGKNKFSDEDIVARMMLAMCLETVRCLEDVIVDTPIEADMGLVLGLGFPAFRGGALRYMDSQGLGTVVELANKYRELGSLYEPTEKLLAMSKAGASYYGMMKELAP